MTRNRSILSEGPGALYTPLPPREPACRTACRTARSTACGGTQEAVPGGGKVPRQY